MKLAKFILLILIVFGSNTEIKAQDENIIQFAQHQITIYISQRPEAADTLEGIHRWWINWPGLPEPPAVTQMALERLEHSGIVEKIRVGSVFVWRKTRT